MLGEDGEGASGTPPSEVTCSREGGESVCDYPSREPGCECARLSRPATFRNRWASNSAVRLLSIQAGHVPCHGVLCKKPLVRKWDGGTGAKIIPRRNLPDDANHPTVVGNISRFSLCDLQIRCSESVHAPHALHESRATAKYA